MDLGEYQRESQKTDRVKTGAGGSADQSVIVPLLGLAGETGELLSEYKKFLRDGNAHMLFKERVAEELGDILWYVTNVATKFGLDLDAIAAHNLKKTRDRWELASAEPSLFPSAYVFDEGFPAEQRFPRRMEVELKIVKEDGKDVIILLVNGEQKGDVLTDNAYTPDGYGFHDIIHFANAAVLGWSPVLRKLLNCKRRKDPKTDEVEDGGRAAAIEEGIAAVVFNYAQHHQFLEGISVLDYNLVRGIKGAAGHLEVRKCSLVDWQSAILQGYAVWRPIAKARGGRFVADLDARTVTLLT